MFLITFRQGLLHTAVEATAYHIQPCLNTDDHIQVCYTDVHGTNTVYAETKKVKVYHPYWGDVPRVYLPEPHGEDT